MVVHLSWAFLHFKMNQSGWWCWKMSSQHDSLSLPLCLVSNVILRVNWKTICRELHHAEIARFEWGITASEVKGCHESAFIMSFQMTSHLICHPKIVHLRRLFLAPVKKLSPKKISFSEKLSKGKEKNSTPG